MIVLSPAQTVAIATCELSTSRQIPTAVVATSTTNVTTCNVRKLNGDAALFEAPVTLQAVSRPMTTFMNAFM